MADDHNAAFSVPVMRFWEVFGANRSVFIAASFLVFLFPLSIAAASIAALVFLQQKKRAAVIACLTLLSVPVGWFTTFRGYPDCGGAVLVYAAIWIYLSRGALLDLRDAGWTAKAHGERC